jgi:hypothetical protein
MAKVITGVVVDKWGIAYAEKRTTSILVEREDGKRKKYRLGTRNYDQIAPGDVIRFKKPSRRNKRLKHVEIVGRADQGRYEFE